MDRRVELHPLFDRVFFANGECLDLECPVNFTLMLRAISRDLLEIRDEGLPIPTSSAHGFPS